MRVYHKLFSEQGHKKADEETTAYVHDKSTEGEYPAPSLSYPECNDIAGNSSKESSEPYDEVVGHHAILHE